MSAAPYPAISVVVPVYSIDPMLGALVDRLAGVLTLLTPRLEIVLLNDGTRVRHGHLAGRRGQKNLAEWTRHSGTCRFGRIAGVRPDPPSLRFGLARGLR
jgi:hypothetical protein